MRAGSDIAFLGGLIRHVINSERWNDDPFFRSWVVNYTNAATIIDAEYRDAEDNDGVFSGLMEYNAGVPEWPYNGFDAQYDDRSWQYAGTRVGDQGRSRGHRAVRRNAGNHVGHSEPAEPPRRQGPPYDDLVRSLLKPPPPRDETLQNPRCVFQIVKRHFSRYTPEMVERTTGCPRDTFLQMADTILANSGADRTTSFAYAVAWTQHTNGPQIIGCCALLQLLLGNFGRPGARHHGAARARLDSGLDRRPDALPLDSRIHAGADGAEERTTRSPTIWRPRRCRPAIGRTCRSSSCRISSRCTARPRRRENDFGYAWHPRIFGDHSHMPMFVAMNDGKVKGMLCIGQNPATSLNAKLEREAMRKLEWLVVKDNWVHETANFWKTAPEVKSGEVQPGRHQDRSLLLSVGAGRRNRGHLYQHAAHDAVALQGG